MRVTLVARDGPDSFLSGDELLRRGNLDILCYCPLLWRTVARRSATATTTMSKRRRQCLKFNKTRESCDGDSDLTCLQMVFSAFSPEPPTRPRSKITDAYRMATEMWTHMSLKYASVITSAKPRANFKPLVIDCSKRMVSLLASSKHYGYSSTLKLV